MAHSLNASNGLSEKLEVDARSEEAVYRKITLRLMPLLFLSYLLAFLDRINVGYAQLQMKGDLGFSDAVYGFGAGIFFLSYLLFEVPSNLLLERVGARLTMLRIMFLWGLTSAATMFVSTPTQFYVVRFLLGVFEAGFFPGIILYLTYWYPSTRRGGVTGQFMFAIPVAGIIGGPISGWILKSMGGVAGLAGWQWMFVIEGLPTALLGIVCFLVLKNKPSEAPWLNDEEKDVVNRVLGNDSAGAPTTHATAKAEFKRAVTDPKVWLLALIYFATACANYTFTFWLPTMIKALGVSDLAMVGWYSAIPYAFAGAGVLLVCKSSDKRKERRWHVGGSLIIAAIGLALTPQLQGSLALTLALLSFVAFFQFGAGIAYWAIPPTYLSKEAAAVGIGLVSSIGVIGGFVSPTLLGFIKTQTGSLTNGIYVISFIMIVGGLAVLLALPKNAVRVGAE
ncbi:MFS transporter [Caballeronia novacaledonica]|uniref:MFS transporter n=1 Tax=Caballeronia novacaledonica TaxID=1544861 RepID=A0AA37MI12_9BURK|nr:MFS transporter [Caballeronia novacaledonica]GJH26998.1 MFS transporter [Caballeronia novacaledonica]